MVFKHYTSGCLHVTVLELASTLGSQSTMCVDMCRLGAHMCMGKLHLNRNRYKICQQEHRQVELHMAGLQDKMEKQSQHSADACSVIAKCQIVIQSSCLLLRRSYIFRATAKNSSVFITILLDIHRILATVQVNSH